MRVRSVQKLAFLSVTDIHTYKHTDAKRHAEQDKALGNNSFHLKWTLDHPSSESLVTMSVC